MVPYLKDMLNIYNRQNFTFENLRKSEFFCIKSLYYNLRIYTAYHFIVFFANCGYIFSDDILINNPKNKSLLKKKSHSTILLLNIQLCEENNSNGDNFAIQNNDLDKIYKLTYDILFNIVVRHSVWVVKCYLLKKKTNDNLLISSNFQKI